MTTVKFTQKKICAVHIANANSYNIFLVIQFSINNYSNFISLHWTSPNDYRDDNNTCKFSGLLSYTMYQLNVLIPISLYKILFIYIHSNRMNE